MSKTKILSAALATGLAATGADASAETATDQMGNGDVVFEAMEDILIYGGEPDSDLFQSLDLSLDDDLIGTEQADDDESWEILAQTVYAGPGGDGLVRQPRGGNITLDNGLKKPQGITLDNGIKRPGKVKLGTGTGKPRKRRGSRKRRQ